MPRDRWLVVLSSGVHVTNATLLSRACKLIMATLVRIGCCYEHCQRWTIVNPNYLREWWDG